MEALVRTAIGQDSHRFDSEDSQKKLMLGGIAIPGYPGLQGNSDADVILHAVTNAVSGITGVSILGAVSDKLCLEQGVTDSKVYLEKALEHLGGYRIAHVSMTLEGKRPKMAPHTSSIRESVAGLLSLSVENVCITATTGEGLTAFGRGEGISVFAIVTAQKTSMVSPA